MKRRQARKIIRRGEANYRREIFRADRPFGELLVRLHQIASEVL